MITPRDQLLSAAVDVLKRAENALRRGSVLNTGASQVLSNLGAACRAVQAEDRAAAYTPPPTHRLAGPFDVRSVITFRNKAMNQTCTEHTVLDGNDNVIHTTTSRLQADDLCNTLIAWEQRQQALRTTTVAAQDGREGQAYNPK